MKLKKVSFFKTTLNWTFAILCISSISAKTFANEPPAEPKSSIGSEPTEPIRAHLTQQKILVSLGEFENTSVGIPFSTNSVEDFESTMRRALAQEDSQKYTNSTLWVLGTAMREEKATLAAFQSKVERLGLAAKGVKVRVLSVPKKLISEEASSLALDALESTLYALPSQKRDYQRPQRSEVLGGLMTAALIETPTFIFLFSHLDPVSAALTASTHALLLTGLNIYSKTMLNWLLRSGVRSEKMQEFEIFVKQMIIPIPFVLNFNIFGKYPQIHSFLSQSDWPTIFSSFGAEVLQFGSNHGLTLALQAAFYSQVIVKGIGKWVAGQKTEDNARDARTVRPWLELAPLSLNAILFAMAASNWGGAYVHLGSIHLNAGQLGLIAITAVAGTILQKFPKLLDPSIPLLRSSLRIKEYFVEKFRRNDLLMDAQSIQLRCEGLF